MRACQKFSNLSSCPQRYTTFRHIVLYRQSPLFAKALDSNFRNDREFSSHSQGSLSEYRRAFIHNDPTIYALSTAPGRAAIAIIRVSGSAWLTVYKALCPGKPLPKPRQATLRTLYEATTPNNNSVLDSGALVLHFPAPDTVTGEDVLEFHVHGGTAVVKAVLAAISKSEPRLIRYAEPGEFTRRAFYNDRLDLTQIEALGDTLAADTEQQRRLAIRGSMNDRSNAYESWRQKLLYARGELEALIDFSEDQHFDESPAQLCASVAAQVAQLRSHLHANIQNASRGELIRNGIDIALVGAPNAGKSSLLNRIVGREAAIVSSEAGTTRDVVDVNVDIGGYLCKFGDLAGLRKQSLSPTMQESRNLGEIEKEGIRRAKNRALSADIVIAVLPVAPVHGPNGLDLIVDIAPEVLKILDRCMSNKQYVVCVLNKVDLFSHESQLNEQCDLALQNLMLKNCINHSETHLYPISCKTQDDDGNVSERKLDGIQAFLEGLTQLFQRMTSAVAPESQPAIGDGSTWTDSLGANERQRTLLQQCLDHLETFLIQVSPNKNTDSDATDQEDEVDIVCAAESLRSAANCLSKITGRGEAGDVEDVLGVVFEK
ncbi:mitochondrial Homoaconitase [Lecanora helva]